MIARPIRSTVCSKAFAVRIGVKIASVSADEPPFGRIPICAPRLAGSATPSARDRRSSPASHRRSTDGVGSHQGGTARGRRGRVERGVCGDRIARILHRRRAARRGCGDARQAARAEKRPSAAMHVEQVPAARDRARRGADRDDGVVDQLQHRSGRRSSSRCRRSPSCRATPRCAASGASATTSRSTSSAPTPPAWCCAPAPPCQVEARRSRRRAPERRRASRIPRATTTPSSTPTSASGASSPTTAASARCASAKADQLMPKAEHLTWEEAASMPLTNCTAYRMLVGPNGARMQQGDVVLIWGAGGGLGGFATQYVLTAAARRCASCRAPRRRPSAARWAPTW